MSMYAEPYQPMSPRLLKSSVILGIAVVTIVRSRATMKRDRKLQAIITQNLRVFGAYWLPGGPEFPAGCFVSCFSMSGASRSFGFSAWVDWSLRGVERVIVSKFILLEYRKDCYLLRNSWAVLKNRRGRRSKYRFCDV